MNYQKLYDELIEHRMANPLSAEEYGEVHHIKMPSQCRYSKRHGERSDYLYDIDAHLPCNLIKLTAKEHYIAHYYLWKIYGGRETSMALHLMMHMKLDEIDLELTSDEYDKLRIEIHKNNVANGHANKHKLVEFQTTESVRRENSKRIANGTHNFMKVLPWDNQRVKTNVPSIRAWLIMDKLYELWLDNDKCGYCVLGRLAKSKYNITARLEGMVNIFKDPEKYEWVLKNWKDWEGRI